MIVCSCNCLSDTAVKSLCDGSRAAPRTVGEVYRCLGCAPQCGRCARTIRALLANATGCSTAACGTCPALQDYDFLDENVDAAANDTGAPVLPVTAVAGHIG